MNRSSIAEHLIKSPICGKSFNGLRFKILRSSTNIFDLIKIEAIYIHINKPKLCKQKEFDYSVSLFSKAILLNFEVNYIFLNLNFVDYFFIRLMIIVVTI